MHHIDKKVVAIACLLGSATILAVLFSGAWPVHDSFEFTRIDPPTMNVSVHFEALF